MRFSARLFASLPLLAAVLAHVPSARAENALFFTQSYEIDAQRRLEVTVGAVNAEDVEGRQILTQYLQSEFRKEHATDPNLKIALKRLHFISPAQREPQSEGPDETLTQEVQNDADTVETETIQPPDQPELLKDTPYWLEKEHKLLVSFTLARFFINGAATTVNAYINAGHFAGSLAIGVTTGLLSAGCMFNYKVLQKFYLASVTRGLLKNRSGPVPRTVIELEKWVRSYLIEVGFVGVIQLASYAVGGAEFHSIATSLGEIGLVAALGTAAQAPWAISNAQSREAALRLASTPEEIFRINRRSSFVELANSVFGVASTIAKMMGVPHATTLFWIQGVSGTANLVRVTLTYQGAKVKANLQNAVNRCQAAVQKLLSF